MNKELFKNIFDAYFNSIRSFIFFRTSNEEIAQDLAQEVFMQLWDRRDKIELRNIKGLLYKIASDMVVSYYRKQNVRVDFAKNIQLEQDTVTPQEKLQFEELRKKYAAVLAKMPENQREVFLMNREESLKYQEIALRLGISVKGVEKRMSNALKMLKENLIYLYIWIVII